MKNQLESLLAKANKLENKFRNTDLDKLKTHKDQTKLFRQQRRSRDLRIHLDEALFNLLELEKENEIKK